MIRHQNRRLAPGHRPAPDDGGDREGEDEAGDEQRLDEGDRAVAQRHQLEAEADDVEQVRATLNVALKMVAQWN